MGDVVVDDESTPAVWASANGRDWEKVLSDPDSLGVLWGVATSADMIVARGSHAEEALDRPDEVWMSRNGREWNVIGSNETFGTPALKQLAVSDNRIVAGGSPNWDVWPPAPATSRRSNGCSDTLDRYGHLYDEDLIALADLMDQRLRGAA